MLNPYTQNIKQRHQLILLNIFMMIHIVIEVIYFILHFIFVTLKVNNVHRFR